MAEQATTEIQGVVRIKICPTKLDEYKCLNAKCIESVRTKDAGTLQYVVYMNSNATASAVFERYRRSFARAPQKSW